MKKLLIFCVLTTFCNFSFAQKTQQEVQDMIKAMTSGKKIPIKPEYNFAGSITYEMTTASNGKPYKGQHKYLYPSESEMTFGTEMNMTDEKGRKMVNRGIIDYQNKAMIMLMDDQKMAMSMPFDMEKTVEGVMNDPNTKMSPPKKTGKTKSIMGYTCEEWVSESAEYTSSMWVSTQMPLNSPNFHKIMQQQMYKNSKILMPSGMNGLMLEMQGTNKKTKENFSMVCVDINKSAVKISTAGYRTM